MPIRRVVVENSSVKLTSEKLEAALTDSCPDARLATVRKADVELTVEQVERGMEDDSAIVQAECRKLFDVSDVDVNRRDPISKSGSFELRQILNEISQIATWTRRKHELKDELLAALHEFGYIFFSTDAREATLRRFGEHSFIDVPAEKRGRMAALRGRRAHLVCLGAGRYSKIEFAAKASSLQD